MYVWMDGFIFEKKITLWTDFAIYRYRQRRLLASREKHTETRFLSKCQAEQLKTLYSDTSPPRYLFCSTCRSKNTLYIPGEFLNRKEQILAKSRNMTCPQSTQI